MKKLILPLLLCLLPLPASAEQLQTFIDFNGELVDQNAAPISGVIPLDFKIYNDAKSKKAIAEESHFVAVVDGAYAIALGEQKEINSKKSELYVAVCLNGKELTRQKVSAQKQILPENPKTVTTDPVGNTNGEFKLECPDGYVVTGISGSTKDGLKSLRAICSKSV